MVLTIAVLLVILLIDQALIMHQLRKTSMALEKLRDAIEHATNVQQAAIVLIKDLADKLNNLAQHPDAEEIRRLAAELRSRADELAGAIAEHAEDEDEPGTEPPSAAPRRK